MVFKVPSFCFFGHLDMLWPLSLRLLQLISTPFLVIFGLFFGSDGCLFLLILGCHGIYLLLGGKGGMHEVVGHIKVPFVSFNPYLKHVHTSLLISFKWPTYKYYSYIFVHIVVHIWQPIPCTHGIPVNYHFLHVYVLESILTA